MCVAAEKQGGNAMLNQRLNSSSRTNFGDIIPHIVQTACAFQSAITFEVDDKRVNAKSIMGVMALASQNAGSIDVCVDGADEEEALKAIEGLLC